MEFFDAHNHLNDEQFKDDWLEVVDEAKNKGVVGMINNGGAVKSSRRAVEQSEAAVGVYAAVGIHPEDLPLSEDLETQVAEILKMASHKKVVAVGELGLDYTLETNREDQVRLIEPQLDLAEKVSLPITLHVRDVAGSNDCFDDLWSILGNFPNLRGQFHCWTGNMEQMKKVLSRDFYISFSGILTYKSAGVISEVAKEVPDDRYLIETDAPYLVPEPRRTEMRKMGMRNSERRCHPAYVTMTAERLAEIRGVGLSDIAFNSTKNTLSLFNKITTS